MGDRISRNKSGNHDEECGWERKGFFSHSVFAPLLSHHRKLQMMVHRKSLWCSIIFSFLGIITIIASVVITALLLNNVIVQHNNDGVVGAVIFCGLGCVLLVVGIIYGVVTYKKSKVKNPDINPELRPEQLLVSACDSMDSPMDCNIVKTGFIESLPLESTETETHNTFIQNNFSEEGPIDIQILDSKNLCNQVV